MENVIQEVGLNAINTIASKIKERNEKIWAHEAFTKYTTRNVNLLKSENAQTENQIKELEADHSRNEVYIKQIRSATEVCKISLKTTCESIRLMNYMKTLQTERTKFFTSRYSDELAECRKRFNEHKSRLEATNPLHKELKDLTIKKKLLGIEVLDVKQKLEDQRNIKKQYRKMRTDIWHRDIIRFAKACLDHYKAREVFYQLKVGESEEKELIKKVFYLQKKVNEKKVLNFRSHIVKSTVPVIDFSRFFSAEEENHISKEQLAIQQKLQELMHQQEKKPQKKATESALPVLDVADKRPIETQSHVPVHQTVKFAPNKSKVHILEVIKVASNEVDSAKVNSHHMANAAQKTAHEELVHKKPSYPSTSQSSTKEVKDGAEASLSQQKSLSQASIICDMILSQKEHSQPDQSNNNLKISQTDTVLSQQPKMQNNEPTKVQANVRNTVLEDNRAQQSGISPHLAKSCTLPRTSDVENTPSYSITNPATIGPQVANEVDKQPVSSPFFQTDLFTSFLNFSKKKAPAGDGNKPKQSSYTEPPLFGFGSKMDVEKDSQLLFSGRRPPADDLGQNSALNFTGELDMSLTGEMQWSPPLQLPGPNGTQEVGALGFQDPNQRNAPESNQFSFGSSNFFNMF